MAETLQEKNKFWLQIVVPAAFAVLGFMGKELFGLNQTTREFMALFNQRFDYMELILTQVTEDVKVLAASDVATGKELTRMQERINTLEFKVSGMDTQLRDLQTNLWQTQVNTSTQQQQLHQLSQQQIQQLNQEKARPKEK